jgi:hypothetical protein
MYEAFSLGFCTKFNLFDLFSVMKELNWNLMFLLLFSEKIAKNLYDEEDIDRLENNDTYADLFLQGERGNIDDAVAMIDGSFIWRKSIGINGQYVVSQKKL